MITMYKTVELFEICPRKIDQVQLGIGFNCPYRSKYTEHKLTAVQTSLYSSYVALLIKSACHTISET
jgi:hypothetical protein